MKTVHDLRYYATALGIHPVDVKRHLGKRVSVHTLTRAELVKLHQKLDEADRGLSLHITKGTQQ